MKLVEYDFWRDEVKFRYHNLILLAKFVWWTMRGKGNFMKSAPTCLKWIVTGNR